jgi:hypothetical protein
MRYSFLLSRALFCASCLGSILRELTTSTTIIALGSSLTDSVGSHPHVTEAPYINLELLRRDVPTALIAPDNTCGYFGGYSSQSFPWFCVCVSV